MMQIEMKEWGHFRNKPIKIIRIFDASNQFQITLTNLGASILQVQTPDRNGISADVHYGRSTPEEFENTDGAYLGTTVGRTLSAIFFANFILDDQQFHLSKNLLKTHHMHGGCEGFDKKAWEIRKAEIKNDNAVIEFNYISPAGEEGYPGNLDVTIIYSIRPNSINITFRATTDAPTIINMTNHGYWNLEGLHNTIDNHELTVAADKYVEYDAGKIALRTVGNLIHFPSAQKTIPKKIINVEGTPFDFRTGNQLSRVFSTKGNIDNNFLLAQGRNPIEIQKKSVPASNLIPPLHTAAILKSPQTGRVLTMKTTAPNLIVYSGNDMFKVTAMGKKCLKHGAICLEPSAPTDAIHHEEFAAWVQLRPSEIFQRVIDIEFTAI